MRHSIESLVASLSVNTVLSYPLQRDTSVNLPNLVARDPVLRRLVGSRSVRSHATESLLLLSTLNLAV